MRLSFSTLACHTLPLAEVLARYGRFGIKGLELRGLGGSFENGRIPEYAPEKTEETLALFAAYGVTPVSLDTSVIFHDPEKYDGFMEEGKASIDIAARLGIPYIRVFGNNLIDPPAETYRRLIGGLTALCRHAKGKGVRVLLETHGDFVTEGRLAPVLEALGSCPTFGLIWDVLHNYAVTGDWMPFYRVIKPYIYHVHIKDYSAALGRQVCPGKGDLPLAAMVRQLLCDGYDGYFSLEWEKPWIPTLEDTEVALDAFVTLMKQIEENT